MQQTQWTATDKAEVAIALVQKLPKVNDKKQEDTRSKDNVAEESKSLTGRYPKDFRGRCKKIAKTQTGKKRKNAKNTQRLANRTTEEVEWETSSEREADDGSTFAVRFIMQEQEPSRKVTLRSDGKDKPPISIKRQFSVGRPDDYYQVHVASPNRKLVVENEPISGGNPFLSDFKHRSQQLQQVSQYSVPMTMEN